MDGFGVLNDVSEDYQSLVVGFSYIRLERVATRYGCWSTTVC